MTIIEATFRIFCVGIVFLAFWAALDLMASDANGACQKLKLCLLLAVCYGVIFLISILALDLPHLLLISTM